MEGDRVGLQPTVLRCGDAVCTNARPGHVWALADRLEDAVALDDEFGAGGWFGSAAARRVWRTELHADELKPGHLVVGIDNHARWSRLEDGAGALFDHLVHLVGGRHVFHVAAVDEGDLFCPLAHARSCAVHRGVAAANHDDAAPFVIRVGQAECGRMEIVESIDDAIRLFAWNAEVVGVVAADRDDHAVVALRLKVGHGEVAAEHLAAFESTAEARDRLVLAVEHLNLWQAVLRNAVTKHAARLWIFFKDGDVMASNEQVVRSRCACWPGADDSNALAAFWLQLKRHGWIEILVPHRLQHLVACVAVAIANRDRLVYLVAAAVIFTWCRADAAEHAWEWNGALEDSC